MFWKKEEPKPTDVKPDYQAHHLDLVDSIFSTDEAKANLLNIAKPIEIDADKVIRDGQLMEMMLKYAPYEAYQKALWVKLLTALRKSLASDSIEKREASRNQVLAHLADLHLPYEFISAKESLLQARELAKKTEQSVKQTEDHAETFFKS